MSALTKTSSQNANLIERNAGVGESLVGKKVAERATKTCDEAERKVEGIEEKVRHLLLIEPRFANFRQEVQEALQYLDEDYKELDNRLTVQALAASTFSLKAVSMDAESRTKSLKFLASEEARVKVFCLDAMSLNDTGPWRCKRWNAMIIDGYGWD
eukprot:Skav216260  [mRNA]  locus=scaffold20:782085:795898:- [translate_table: standard]